MKLHIKSFSNLSLIELYWILKLRVDVFVVEQNCPYPEIDGIDLHAQHLFFEKEGSIASYLRLYVKNEEYISLGRVATGINYRGQGLSSQLIRRCISEAEKRFKGRDMIIGAQAHLEKFYGSFGFQKVSDVYLEDGIPHIDMLLRRAERASDHKEDLDEERGGGSRVFE